jgi:hypothetical protein
MFSRCGSSPGGISEIYLQVGEQRENFKESCYIAETYYLNMVISEKLFLKKSDGFGAFFSTNVLCICHTRH